MRCIEIEDTMTPIYAIKLELIHEMYWNKGASDVVKAMKNLNWYMRCIEIVLENATLQIEVILELIHEMYWNTCLAYCKLAGECLNWYMRCIEINVLINEKACRYGLNWYMRCIEIS